MKNKTGKLYRTYRCTAAGNNNIMTLHYNGKLFYRLYVTIICENNFIFFSCIKNKIHCCTYIILYEYKCKLYKTEV